jgi:hypothetical protein
LFIFQTTMETIYYKDTYIVSIHWFILENEDTLIVLLIVIPLVSESYRCFYWDIEVWNWRTSSTFLESFLWSLRAVLWHTLSQ